MKYIQNRTNWCWVAACKVAGEQYKKNFTEFAFTLESPETEVAVSNLDGLRTDIVKRRNGIYFVDAWQSAIARNADFLHGGLEGNFPGNDQTGPGGEKPQFPENERDVPWDYEEGGRECVRQWTLRRNRSPRHTVPGDRLGVL
jgi:hypothetical protein